MTKKWVVGLVGVFAVLALSGVGFSMFTAQATVNGSATAATMGIQITAHGVGGGPSAYTCYSWPIEADQYAPGNFSFYGENAQMTSINAVASNLTPGVYCGGWVNVTNVGTVPVNLSVALEYTTNICPAFVSHDCYDYSGWDNIDPAILGNTAVTNITLLMPGGTYHDFFVVGIVAGSDDSTPGSAYFTLAFTATAGF